MLAAREGKATASLGVDVLGCFPSGELILGFLGDATVFSLLPPFPSSVGFLSLLGLFGRRGGPDDKSMLLALLALGCSGLGEERCKVLLDRVTVSAAPLFLSTALRAPSRVAFIAKAFIGPRFFGGEVVMVCLAG